MIVLRLLKKHIKTLVALLMLVLLYRYGLFKLAPLIESLKNPTILLSGIVFISIQFLFFSLRWKNLINLKSILLNSTERSSSAKLSLKSIFKYHQMGQFFNTFIPGGVGGDVIKAVALSTEQSIPKKVTLSSVAIDRLFGLYFMIVFSFIFLGYEYFISQEDVFPHFRISLVLFAVSSFGLLFARSIKKMVYQINLSLKEGISKKISFSILFLLDSLVYKANFKDMFYSCIYSFIAQLSTIGFLYLTSTLLIPDLEFSFPLFFSLSCFTFMATAIPITPGGIGLGQAAIYYIFKDFNLSLGENLITSISLMQLFTILLSLPGWYYFIVLKKQTHIEV